MREGWFWRLRYRLMLKLARSLLEPDDELVITMERDELKYDRECWYCAKTVPYEKWLKQGPWCDGCKDWRRRMRAQGVDVMP